MPDLAYTGGTPDIAYMPPATEFNYYIAIGEGVKAEAASLGAETFMLAPQSGADIAGQMGMIQDVITQGVDAIILSTHDEAPPHPWSSGLSKQGIAVIIVNNDIPNFPSPVHGVVGYSQRRGTYKMGMYVAGMFGGVAKVGVLEGQPGYHSTERIGGYTRRPFAVPGDGDRRQPAHQLERRDRELRHDGPDHGPSRDQGDRDGQ